CRLQAQDALFCWRSWWVRREAHARANRCAYAIANAWPQTRVQSSVTADPRRTADGDRVLVCAHDSVFGIQLVSLRPANRAVQGIPVAALRDHALWTDHSRIAGLLFPSAPQVAAAFARTTRTIGVLAPSSDLRLVL